MGKNDLRIQDYQGYQEGEGWAEVRGLGQDPQHDPHDYLNALLDAAVHTIPVDQEGPFELHTTVYVKHSSPGWWDGFRQQLTGGGS